VDMRTTQARCPHAHSDKNKSTQLTKLQNLPTRSRDEAKIYAYTGQWR
jgi:hypothetical protein